MTQKPADEWVSTSPDEIESDTPPPVTLQQRDRVIADPDSKPNFEAFKRIMEKVFLPMMKQGSTEVAAKILQKTDTYGSTRELLEELDLLDEWEITIRDSVSVTKQDTGMTQFLLVQRFLESIVDREGWYTATWFKEQYAIEPSRLRKAAQRGQLPKLGEQRKTVYSYEAARRLWPHEITH